MTSKIIVNTIEADTGISSVTFASNINLQNDSSVLVSSSGIRLGTGSTIAAPSANEITLSTNSAERLRLTSAGNVGIGSAIPANVLDVQGTTHTKIHVGTTGTGHATGIQINHAKGNAALQEWQLQTDGSADGNLKIRNATSSTDVMFFDADNNNIGINITNPERKLEVVDTAGSLTFPVAVSNHTNASAGVGAGIAFHLTAGGNARGELGLVYAGNSNSDGTDFVFRPNDGSTGQVERLRITSAGNIGIGDASPTKPLTVGTTTPVILLDDQSSRTLEIRGPSTTHNATVLTTSTHDLLLGTNNAERLRITSNGSIGTKGLVPTDGSFVANSTIRSQNSSSNISYIGFTEYTGNTTVGSMYSYMGGDGRNTGYLTLNTNDTERLRITSAGYVLKSDTPAFQCKLSAATGANFTGVLVFNSVSYNIGSHYNSTNGKFTAPVDGRYLFCWYTNMERAGGNGSFYADWMINGSNRGNRMYTHHSGAWEMIGGNIIFDLNANDYVQINAITSGNWDGGSYGSYSGYLLG